jgi:hypothetical protein
VAALHGVGRAAPGGAGATGAWGHDGEGDDGRPEAGLCATAGRSAVGVRSLSHPDRRLDSEPPGRPFHRMRLPIRIIRRAPHPHRIDAWHSSGLVVQACAGHPPAK